MCLARPCGGRACWAPHPTGFRTGPGQEESLHSEEVAGGDRGKGVHPQTGGDFVARIPMDPYGSLELLGYPALSADVLRWSRVGIDPLKGCLFFSMLFVWSLLVARIDRFRCFHGLKPFLVRVGCRKKCKYPSIFGFLCFLHIFLGIPLNDDPWADSQFKPIHWSTAGAVWTE